MRTDCPKHGKAEVELDLRQRSKEVSVSMDCKGLKFTDTDDPSKLAAAGIPVPRATIFLQKEVPLNSKLFSDAIQGWRNLD